MGPVMGLPGPAMSHVSVRSSHLSPNPTMGLLNIARFCHRSGRYSHVYAMGLAGSATSSNGPTRSSLGSVPPCVPGQVMVPPCPVISMQGPLVGKAGTTMGMPSQAMSVASKVICLPIQPWASMV